MATVECFFGLDHPAAGGHFPGNPIIPGAVLLHEMVRAIEHDLGVTLAPFTIKSAKFFSPTHPGDRVVIEFSRGVAGDIRFTCAVEGRKVLAGQIQCSAAPTAP